MALVLDYVATQPEFGGLPVYLVGHSRGAGVSLVYALDHPSRCPASLSWNGVTNLDLLPQNKKKKCVHMAAAMSLMDEQGSICHWMCAIIDDLDNIANVTRLLTGCPSSPVRVALIQGTEDGPRLRDGSAAACASTP